MKLDKVGINFLKAREGLRLQAYLDVAGIPTIGYGTTVYPSGNHVKIGDTCTDAYASVYFEHDLKSFEAAVNHLVKMGGEVLRTVIGEHVELEALKQNQYNALVAFCYNVGEGQKGFAGSKLLERVNQDVYRNDRDAISQAFLLWNKITVIKNGVKVKEVSPGLVNRRMKEINLYFS